MSLFRALTLIVGCELPDPECLTKTGLIKQKLVSVLLCSLSVCPMHAPNSKTKVHIAPDSRLIGVSIFNEKVKS